MRFQWGEKKKEEVVTYDEKGVKIETPRDIVKELGPLPVPVPDELPPLELEIEEHKELIAALSNINQTLKEIKQSLDSYRTAVQIKPAAQPIAAAPPKNKGGRPKGYSPKLKKIVTEEV